MFSLDSAWVSFLFLPLFGNPAGLPAATCGFDIMSHLKTIFGLRLKLIWGTPRRLIWSLCRPGYVRKSLARRSGECQRCGACCRLVWRCRFYHEDDGVPACKLYRFYRPPNCSNFPIDHHDIADRDIISPDEPCGFSWARAEKGQGD